MPFTHILVATDFNESADNALALAIEFSAQFKARLTLVHCWEAPTFAYGAEVYAVADVSTPIQAAASRRLQEALVALRARVPEAEGLLRCGPAWEEILAAATELQADLIVVGTHGRQGLSHLLIGSVAERVVRMARVPVLSVRKAELPKAPG